MNASAAEHGEKPECPVEKPIVLATNAPVSNIQQLLAKASRAIERGEDYLREAARYIAEANRAGATQRQIAETIHMAQSWVNRLIRWHHDGAVDTPFGPQSKRRREKAKCDQAPDHDEEASSSDFESSAASNGSTELESGVVAPSHAEIPAFLLRLSVEEQEAADEIARLWFAATDRVRGYLRHKLLENEIAV